MNVERLVTGNIAEYMASYGASIRYGGITPEVVHRVKRFIIDTLACAIENNKRQSVLNFNRLSSIDVSW